MSDTQRTKKLINDPDDVIAELIEGMTGAHPDLLRVADDDGRALVAQDGPCEGKVGIVIGGGSGHEPLFSGYVGRGLADAAAIGNVFASPSPRQIADAARAVDRGAGVVFLYGNYTGDVMNFDMAAELLASDGIDVRSVQVHDDVASAPRTARIERRGIAGDIFVFKVAGAIADRGGALDEVERMAQAADAATASMGVALDACSLPQTRRPNFEIGPTEIEIGMGIHGEPGIERIELETADRVADRLLEPVLADLDIGSSDNVAVMVNGLGATSMMELYIMHRHVRRRLSKRGVAIHRSWVGNYATSLDMAGASVTLMRLDEALQAALDHPCRTPALTIGVAPAPRTRSASHTAHRTATQETPSALRQGLIAEGPLTPVVFRHLMETCAAHVSAEADTLSRLDGAVGDGDHGVTMQAGWGAIRDRLAQMDADATISDMTRAMADAFLDSVGATAGPLYASGFLEAAKAVDDRLNLDAPATARWIGGVAAGIRARGGAAPGDKTMVDAWHPAAVAAEATADQGGSVADTLLAAARAAAEGRARTEKMEPRRGRAAKLGRRAVGHADPGATSAALVLLALSEAFRTEVA